VASPKPYRLCKVGFDKYLGDFIAGGGEEDVDRQGLLAALKTYLEARHQRADWSAIGKSSSESLVNLLAIASPYGPEEKQALLEAPTLKARAEALVALAEMELAAGAGGVVATEGRGAARGAAVGPARGAVEHPTMEVKKVAIPGKDEALVEEALVKLPEGILGAPTVRELDSELTRLGKAHEFYSYAGAGHAFMDRHGNKYNARADQASWPRTLDFFRRYLVEAAPERAAAS
jgi:hypothetical protein